jgi:excisionase family DNA binding protein
VARTPKQQPDLMFGVLALVAQSFGADPASFLTELNASLDLTEAIHRGYRVRPGSVPAPSRAMVAAKEAIESAARHFLALGNASQSPNALAAGLGIPGGDVGANSLMAASSEAGEMTVGEAAGLLGVTAERVRQLARAGVIKGRRARGGRHEWHLLRASVLGERSSRDGHGSDSRRRSA